MQKQLIPFQTALGLSFIPKTSQQPRTAPAPLPKPAPHLTRPPLTLPLLLLSSPFPADELQVVFTRISRALPSRPFTLSVCVNASNDYEIPACNPAVPTLPGLLAELNHPQDGDFARFLFQVRKEFQRIALE